MDYFESAEGEIISQARAIQEVKKHGVELVEEFLQDMGVRESYEAQEVLIWLGY